MEMIPRRLKKSLISSFRTKHRKHGDTGFSAPTFSGMAVVNQDKHEDDDLETDGCEIAENMENEKKVSGAIAEEICKSLTDVACEKNPLHIGFMPVVKLAPAFLPEPYHSQDWVDYFKLKSYETVKLTVSSTSVNRPDDLGFAEMKGTKILRVGTGTAFIVDMKNAEVCNCSDFEGPHQISGPFRVMTAAHVVFDDLEAEHTNIEFFYDSEEDKSDVVIATGVRIISRDIEKNRSVLECRTHDLTLIQRLEGARDRRELIRKRLEKQLHMKPMVLLISHPHGCAKHISFGELRELKEEGEIKTSDGIQLIGCILTYTTPSCPGAGGGTINLIGEGEICLAFAPHCASMSNGKNISGLGWTKYPLSIKQNALQLRNNQV